MDMFDKAKKDQTKKEKKEASAEAPVVLGEALTYLAAIDHVSKQLSEKRKVYEAEVKLQMEQQFVTKGVELADKPASFKAAAEDSTASCEIKRRSSSSVLSDEEVKEFKTLGIPVIEEVVSEESYILNPALLKDPELRKKLVKALQSVDFGDITPVLYTPAQKRFLVSDETVSTIFKAGKKVAASLFSKTCTMAVKTAWTGSFGKAMSLLSLTDKPKGTIE